MHLCIFKAACRIDRVLIVFPGVLEGSARGIDQSQTRLFTLWGWQGPSLLQAEGNVNSDDEGMKAGERSDTAGQEEESLLGCAGK